MASIDPKYFLVISDVFAADLGLPKKLLGVIHGHPVPEHFTSDKYRSEYLNFFDSKAGKKIVRIASGYYPSANDIKRAFKLAGADIENPMM